MRGDTVELGCSAAFHLTAKARKCPASPLRRQGRPPDLKNPDTKAEFSAIEWLFLVPSSSISARPLNLALLRDTSAAEDEAPSGVLR